MNDLINRQDAIDEVINLWADKPFGNPALVEIKDCIEALPSAERKRGEWKFYSRDEDAFDVYGNESWAIRYYCSNCNFMHAFIENHTAQYNFCPNCGAEMRGGDANV